MSFPREKTRLTAALDGIAVLYLTKTCSKALLGKPFIIGTFFGWDPKKSLTALELDVLSSSLQYKKENKSSWSSAVSES